MSGVTLSDLSKYHQGAMKWFKDGLVSEHNKLFAQTEEAGAVSFWPLGGTPLEGKVKFSFKETPPASGDKGPENPSTIAGASQIHVANRGKNFYIFNPDTSYTYYGVTISVSDDKTITLNGTCNISIGGNKQIYVGQTPTISIPIEKHVVASIKHISGSYSFASGLSQTYPTMTQMARRDKQNGTMAYLWMRDSGIDSTSIKDFGYYSAASVNRYCLLGSTLFIYGGVTYNNYKIQIQYEFTDDENPTEYEPPIKQSATIDLGNTYYGGEIDLATGVMTVTWGGKIFDGTESWTIASDSTDDILNVFSNANLPTQEMNNTQNATTRFCTHFPYKQPLAVNTVFTWGGATRVYFRLPRSSFASGTDVSNWLASEYNAGHPVILAYLLYVPKTVQLTPLQLTALTQKDKYTSRMNTVYTDADSIQIRYRKSLIHDEDEKVQAIVALGGNV